MRRITILTDCQVGSRGGSELHVQVLAELLLQAGCGVQLIELARPPSPCARLPREVRHDRLPTGRILSLHGAGRIAAVARLVRSHASEALISFFETSDIVSALIGRLAGCRTLVSSRRDTGFRYSSAIRRAYRLLNGRFDRVVVPSMAVFDSVRREGVADHRIALVPNGVDTQLFSSFRRETCRAQLGLDQQAFIIFTSAALTPVKDFPTVLRAARVLLDRGVPFEWLIAGTGDQLEMLRSLASELNVARHVHWLGDRDDIPQLLAASDVFAMSSLTEGLSNSVLEALAAARPVVVTAVGGNVDLVSQGVDGFLVPARSDGDLAERLAELSRSPDLRQRLGEAGRRKILLHYSRAAMRDGYLAATEPAAGGTRS